MEDNLYQASRIKRRRRTREEMGEFWWEMRQVIEAERPMTVRQVFYQMAARGAVPKTENGYDLVQRDLAEMRRRGALPYYWISDNTRWMTKPTTDNGIEAMLKRSIELYRRALWADQSVRVEVWCEKDALSGIISDVTEEFDVPLYVARGFSSLTYIYNAAESIRRVGKPTFIYYFGDYDPSGVLIPVRLEAELRKYAPGVPIAFNREAINPEQIEQFQLPTRPTKKTKKNAHGALHFADESVDLDALPANTLRALVRECIERHIGPDVLERTRRIEAQERETLRRTFGFTDGGRVYGKQ